MRIQVQLPRVQPGEYEAPKECPYGCGGRHFKPHGQKGEAKPMRDLRHAGVKSWRRKCTKCGRTFRVYPRGVSRATQSDHLKAMSVLLYVLGLSYGAVADFLSALGVALGKTTVYRNVQAAGVKSRERQQHEVACGGKKPVMGTDATYVKVKGAQVGVQVVVDDASGDLLGLDIVVSENTEAVLAVVRAVAQQVDAEVLVSDDLDTYKEVADGLGMDHQVCRNHVKRNVDAVAERIREQVKPGEAPPAGVDSSLEQLQTDLECLQALVRQRPPDAPAQLEALYHCYQAAPGPRRQGERHSAWYRMRMLITRLWDRWRRLTLDQRRDDLDGTNNASERLIGWWIKERYRLMRGYKRTESIQNVVTLTARMGVRSGRYDMTELYT